MKEFNYIASGFCAAAALINLMSDQYMMCVVMMFLAYANFRLAENDNGE